MRFGVGALLLVCACGSAEAEEQGGPRGRPPAQVVVASATTGTLAVERTYLGQVRALARAELAAGASGEVLEVTVREGDRVSRGDLLVRLDSGRARAQLAAARAARTQTQVQREQAAREAERYQGAGEAVAAVETERATTQVAALEAQSSNLAAAEREARETVSRHRVVAPFDGVVSSRLVDLGDWVTEGTAVLELVATDETEVLVRVEPELTEHLDTGHSLTLRRGEHTQAAHVEGIVPALELTTRTAQLRVLPDAHAAWLLPGTTVDVSLTIERDGDGVLVPRDALVPGVAETRVFVVSEGSARPITVDVRDRGADQARVVGEGLATGMQVIVQGNDRLRPGQPVEIVDAP